MEVFGPFLDGHANVHNQLWEHLRVKTFNALDASSQLKAAMTDPEEALERGRIIRDTFLNSIGRVPAADSPLNPQYCGNVQRQGYTIEKIIFESQPKTYVTSLLYVPEHREQPAPAILFVSGHGREAKAFPEYQRVCHDLAINGFVVLAIDPTGQGERVTHFDPDTGKMLLDWGTIEHSYQGQQCVLTGTSIARYFLCDALCGIDYLQSRPEVDADRIGLTGNSGGGTQTSLACMSGDPRIKVAAPCTYVTSREDYYLTGQPQDMEQLQFGMTRDGINFDDFFIPFAPRPLLIGAVTSDFFCPEGTALSYERLRRTYGLFGREDNVQCVFAPGPHMYCRELRMAVVNWFRRHLLDAIPDFVSSEDDAFEILPDAELWCTRKGHVRSDFPDAQTPYTLNLACLPERRTPKPPEALRACVIETLRIEERLRTADALYPRTVRKQTVEEFEAHSVFFCSEPGIYIAGCLLSREVARMTSCTIYLRDQGLAGFDQCLEQVRGLLQDGHGVFVVEVRGKGLIAPHPVNGYDATFPMSFFNTESWFANSAYCLGENLPGMRVFDVMRAAEYLRRHRGCAALALRAEGLVPSLYGYLAAALDTSIESTCIDGLIPSFEAIVRTEHYRTDFGPSLLLHGVLQAFDLPELRTLFAGRSLDIVPASVARVFDEGVRGGV